MNGWIRSLGACLTVAGMTAGCGASRPPADFAPAPGLASRISQIRVVGPPAVCPGERIRTGYYAVLNDGTEIPFSTEYDEDNPPPLHVIMLSRTSPDAYPRESGDWDSDPDPLRSAVDGFRLSAFLKVKPAANGFTTVAPSYHCARNEWVFTGQRGNHGTAGLNGPDVTVRLGVVSSPFYDRLLVAGLEVGVAPPQYVLMNADEIPPADWLRVASRGGPGGRGEPGSKGSKGADGEPGCPGSPGGAGGAGGPGGPGGPGGMGGRITVIVPEDEPFLAGLVDGRAPGGPGGRGGAGGAGGEGGKGGEALRPSDRRCTAGADGEAGPAGAEGREGRDGPPGPPPQTITVPFEDVFGVRAPATLQRMINGGVGSTVQN